MSKATWSGSVSFGMVTVPITLHTAVDGGDKVSFHQINSRTGNRIRNQKVDSLTYEVVENDQIVKGYEHSPGKHIQITDEEIKTLLPERNSSIELLGFTDSDHIDSLSLDTPYHVGTDGVGAKPYAALESGMRKTGKVAIGRFVMRSKEYLCTIKPDGNGGLVLTTLRWQDQIRDVGQKVRPPTAELNETEENMAAQLVNSMDMSVDIKELKESYTARVREMLTKKASGEEIFEPHVEVEEDLPSEDLFEDLVSSIEQLEESR